MSTAQSQITVTIAAVDKATATINKVNKTVSGMMGPVAKLGASLKNFGEASGVAAVGRQLRVVYHAAGRLGGQLKGVVERMGELAGIATVAGVAAIATEWGRLGFEVERTSLIIGASTTQLQQWRAMSVLVGGSADDASKAMQQFGDTMEDALYGRNPMALSLMAREGIHMHRAADGTLDYARSLDELSNAMRSMPNAQARNLLARSFGMESMVPLLMMTREQRKAMEDLAVATGATMPPDAIQRAYEFEQNILKGKTAITGLRNEIGDKLIPVLSPLVDRFVKWEETHGEEFAQKVADGVDAIVQALPPMIQKVNEAVDTFGGWGNVAKVVGGVIALNVLAPTITLVAQAGKLAFIFGGALLKNTLALAGAIGTELAPGLVAAVGLTNEMVAGMTAAAIGLGAVSLAIAGIVGAYELYENVLAGTGIGDMIGEGVAFIGASLGFQEPLDAYNRMHPRNRGTGTPVYSDSMPVDSVPLTTARNPTVAQPNNVHVVVDFTGVHLGTKIGVTGAASHTVNYGDTMPNGSLP